jgi:hypothetical protein
MQPRLIKMAAHLETAQSHVLRFLEQRWVGGAPESSVIWPRQFKLDTVIDDINDVFNAQGKTGLKSPTLTADLMLRIVQELGLETDVQKLELIMAEYLEAAQLQKQRSEQSASALGFFGG